MLIGIWLVLYIRSAMVIVVMSVVVGVCVVIVCDWDLGI